jgi:hypothetical protein
MSLLKTYSKASDEDLVLAVLTTKAPFLWKGVWG